MLAFGGGRMGKVINECIQDSNDMRLVQWCMLWCAMLGQML